MPLLQRDTLAFESPLAYDGGPDGTRILRRILAGAPPFLRPGGTVLLELGGEEAEALSAWIRTLPEVRQQELASRFHQALLKLAAAGLIDRMVSEDWLAESETHHNLAIDYLYQRIPCPFLEDESCSIYPMRPLVCREYLVSSAPEHCYDPANQPVVPVYLPLNFSRVLNRIGAELENDSRGWIPLVFLFAWMKGDAHPGERIAGDGPQVLYEFVKRISAAALPEPYAEPSAEE